MLIPNTPDLQTYLAIHTTPETPILSSLRRETHLKVLMPQMLSGHLQGQFLQLISQMIQPRRILEIGTFTGYSAICLCAGLSNDGLLHTIDNNEELRDMQLQYFRQAGLEDKIRLHIGNAGTIIPDIEDTLDLVFIDADKQNYAHYYDLVIDKVRIGGFILADNALQEGKVLQAQKNANAEAIDNFNRKVQNDPRVQNLLLPLRDGIMIAVKTTN